VEWLEGLKGVTVYRGRHLDLRLFFFSIRVAWPSRDSWKQQLGKHPKPLIQCTNFSLQRRCDSSCGRLYL